MRSGTFHLPESCRPQFSAGLTCAAEATLLEVLLLDQVRPCLNVFAYPKTRSTGTFTNAYYSRRPWPSHALSPKPSIDPW